MQRINGEMHKISVRDIGLTESDKREIERLLKRSPHNPPQLEDIWMLMDEVWDQCECDNQKLDWKKVRKFYSHPVWLLNGFFIEQHALSMQHRYAISDWIADNPSIRKILDYGGGFGTLARLIADKKLSLSVDIYEPHPSDYSRQKISNYAQIEFISKIKDSYDALVSTDVLEHVPDPLKTFEEMILSVKNDGYLIIANNFFPVIKCHLPQTFHFRYTFNVFVKLMGLVIVGPLERSHATIFRKNSNKPVNWRMVRLLEKVSKSLFPLIEFSKPVLRPIYKFVKHEYSPR
jgi:SAM-dependent methyltransferase